MEEQNGTKLSSKPLTGKKKLVNKLSVSFEILSSLKKNVSGIIQAQKKKKNASHLSYNTFASTVFI